MARHRERERERQREVEDTRLEFISFNPGCFKDLLLEEVGACKLFLLTPRTDRRCCASLFEGLTSTCFTALGDSLASAVIALGGIPLPYSVLLFSFGIAGLPGKISGRSCGHLP